MKISPSHILFFLLAPALGICQNNQNNTESKVNIYLLRANSYYDSANYDSSLFYFEKMAQEEEPGISDEAIVGFKIKMIDAYINKGAFNQANAELIKALHRMHESKSEDSLNMFILHYLDGEIKYKTGKYVRSRISLKECLHNLNNSAYPNDSLKVLILKGLGNIELKSGNANAALSFYLGAKNILTKHIEQPDPVLGPIFLNMALAYDMLKKFDSADYYFSKSISVNSKYAKGNTLLAGSYANYSNYLIKFGKTKKALNYIMRAEKLYKEKYGKGYYRLAYLYLTFAKIYMLNNDYRQALSYFIKSENIYQKYLPVNDIKFENLDANMALLYKYMSNYEKSIEKYNSDALINSTNPITQIVRLRNIGECHLRLGNLNEARECFQDALSRSLDFFGENHLQTATCYLSYADYYTTIGDEKKAGDCLNVALQFFIGFYGPNNREVTNVYNKYSINSLKMKAYGKAARMAQQALISITPGYSDTSIFSNPEFDRLQNDYHAVAALALKANALGKQMLQYPSKSKFAAETLETALLGIRLFETFKASLEEENSQLFNTEKINILYQYALLSAWQEYKITGEQKFRELAFQQSEKNKAGILASGMDKLTGSLNNYVPDSLLQKERNIKQELRTFSSLIHEENKNALQDSAKLVWLQNKMFDTRRELDTLLNYFLVHYPKYYSLKNSQRVSSIAEIQGRLTRQEVLVEYALTDPYLYIFAIGPDTVCAVQVEPGPDFRQTVEEFLVLLHQPPSFDRTPKELIREYSDLSNKIYQVLIGSIDPLVKNKELIVIPDDVLGYLPFETLVSKPWDTAYVNFRKLPYLLKTNPVSYHYSSSLWMNGSPNKTARHGTQALVMAPLYKPDERPGDSSIFDRLAYLNFTGTEAEWVHETMGGKLFLDSLATEGNFKTYAPEYPILHLAMHTLLDDENPMSSKLIFSRPEDSLEDGLLNTYEIYDLKLKAEMVVLSACETGSGKLRKGEGIMSMARGFLFAGVPSLLITHWKVDDGPAAQIMEGFYKRLENGKRKALQQAKLDYLAHSDQIFSHPFYWGAYVVIGDDSPVKKTGFPTFLYLILTGGLVGLIFWIIKRKT